MRVPLNILVISALVLACATIAGAPGQARASTTAAPPDVWISQLASTNAIISWTRVPGAVSYDVLRSGRRLGTVRGTRASVTRLAPGSWHVVQVRARLRSGMTGASDPLPVVTTAPTRCTRWVSPTLGTDASDGRSSARPLRTVQRLVESWQPGDVGCVTGLVVEDVNITRGGSASAPVVLRSAPGAARAQIRGRIQVARTAQHVIVANLRLDGRANRGPGAQDLPSPTINGNDVRFLDNDVSNARTRVCFVIGSIRGWGRAHRTVLARNRIHDCGARDRSGAGNNHHHGVYVEGADDTRITQNVIFQNADRGIQLYPDAQRSQVIGNVIDGNGEGIIFSGAEGFASSSNLVLRNVVTNSRTRSDIEHWWEQPRSPGMRNRAVRNCVGGAVQGAFARPIVGYVASGNRVVRQRWRNAARGDFRAPARGGSACARWLRSRGLPLAPR